MKFVTNNEYKTAVEVLKRAMENQQIEIGRGTFAKYLSYSSSHSDTGFLEISNAHFIDQHRMAEKREQEILGLIREKQFLVGEMETRLAELREELKEYQK